jgi:hypothetical protein
MTQITQITHPPRNRQMDTVPIILCEQVEGVLRFWCRYCRKWHLHGPGGGGKHHVAHCYPQGRSPYAKSGYVLVAAPVAGALDCRRGPRTPR